MAASHDAPPADGFTARWETWDGEHGEVLSLAWDNEGWTATGVVDRHDVQYVVRLSPLWQVRQFLLFRDLDQPDLWIGTDGHGRWGEINGAHRVDLDGGIDVSLRCSPFTHAIPIRRLDLEVGDESASVVLDIDVETLGIVPAGVSYRRLEPASYEVVRDDGTTRIPVDEFGVPTDIEGRFRRTA